MDVKEFLDTMSLICNKGVDTKQFKESYIGKKMAKGNPKYKTFGFDFYDMWYIYTDGNINDYYRDSLFEEGFKNPPNYTTENLKYANIFYEQWCDIVKYAILCYLAENNFIYEKKNSLDNTGWYIYVFEGKKTLFTPTNTSNNFITDFQFEGSNLVIGYDGKPFGDSYDFNFQSGVFYWNLNHSEPWDNPYFFTPTFLSKKPFLNWEDSKPWQVKS
jgi:hypothetical protein